MARTAFWGPAHRVMQRMTLGSSGGPPNAAPSLDMGGSGIQDSRLLYNSANSSTGAQVIGWMDANCPFLDFVPSTLSAVAIAAAQAGVAGTALTLRAATGAGITVSAAPTLMLGSQNIIPTGARFIDSIPVYQRFGASDFTVLYDAATMGARCLTITSAGDDHLGTLALVGFDAYGYLLHETVTLADATTAQSVKAYKGLISATPGRTLSGSNISIGQSDTYGLPMYAAAASSVWGFWNSLIVTGTGTFTAGVTTTPSATTGDVRGTYLVGSASDGTKRMTLWQHPVLPAMITSGINAGLFGAAQF